VRVEAGEVDPAGKLEPSALGDLADTRARRVAMPVGRQGAPAGKQALVGNQAAPAVRRAPAPAAPSSKPAPTPSGVVLRTSAPAIA